MRWREGFTSVALVLLALVYLMLGLAAAHEGLEEFGTPAWLSIVIVGTLLMLRLSLVLVGLAIYGAYAGWEWHFLVALAVFLPAVAVMFAVGASALIGTAVEAVRRRWRKRGTDQRPIDIGGDATGNVAPVRHGSVRDTAKAEQPIEPRPANIAPSHNSVGGVAESARTPTFASRYFPLAFGLGSVSVLAVVLFVLDKSNSGHAGPPRQDVAVLSQAGTAAPSQSPKSAATARPEPPSPPKTLVTASGLRLAVPGYLNVQELPQAEMATDRTRLLAGAWALDGGEKRQLLLLKGSDQFLPRFRYADALKSPMIEQWRDHISRNIQKAYPSGAVRMRPTSASGLFKALLTNHSRPGAGECLVGAVLADNQLAELTLCTEGEGLDETLFDAALASLETLNPSIDFQKGSIEERLNTEYWAARERLSEAESLLLRNEQRRWVAEREVNCGSHAPLSSELFACLDRAAEKRMDELASFGNKKEPQVTSSSAPTPTSSTTSSDDRGTQPAGRGL